MLLLGNSQPISWFLLLHPCHSGWLGKYRFVSLAFCRKAKAVLDLTQTFWVHHLSLRKELQEEWGKKLKQVLFGNSERGLESKRVDYEKLTFFKGKEHPNTITRIKIWKHTYQEEKYMSVQVPCTWTRSVHISGTDSCAQRAHVHISFVTDWLICNFWFLPTFSIGVSI